MTFTVVWAPAAEKELAAAWLAAKDRDRLTAMASVLEGLLRVAPELLGESRGDDRRIILHGGLALVYEVALDDRLVRILALWAT
jgi:plasmid stabilization system protein ParE